MVMLHSLLVGVALADPCAAPVAADRLAVDLTDARAAFRDLDVDRFHLSLDAAVIGVPCLDEVVSPAIATELHTLQGVRWFVAGDERNAVTAFAAAKRISGDRSLVDDLFPEGHAARGLWAQANAASVVVTPVPVPVAGATWFDGAPAADRPDVPALFQLLDAEGKVLASAWLKPTDALPAYDGELPRSARGAVPSLGWFAGAGALAAVSGGLYAVAVRREAAFDEPHPEWSSGDDIRRYATMTNLATVGSAASLAGAVGLGVVGVVRF